MKNSIINSIIRIIIASLLAVLGPLSLTQLHAQVAYTNPGAFATDTTGTTYVTVFDSTAIGSALVWRLYADSLGQNMIQSKPGKMISPNITTTDSAGWSGLNPSTTYYAFPTNFIFGTADSTFVVIPFTTQALPLGLPDAGNSMFVSNVTDSSALVVCDWYANGNTVTLQLLVKNSLSDPWSYSAAVGANKTGMTGWGLDSITITQSVDTAYYALLVVDEPLYLHPDTSPIAMVVTASPPANPPVLNVIQNAGQSIVTVVVDSMWVNIKQYSSLDQSFVTFSSDTFFGYPNPGTYNFTCYSDLGNTFPGGSTVYVMDIATNTIGSDTVITSYVKNSVPLQDATATIIGPISVSGNVAVVPADVSLNGNSQAFLWLDNFMSPDTTVSVGDISPSFVTVTQDGIQIFQIDLGQMNLPGGTYTFCVRAECASQGAPVVSNTECYTVNIVYLGIDENGNISVSDNLLGKPYRIVNVGTGQVVEEGIMTSTLRPTNHLGKGIFAFQCDNRSLKFFK